MERNQSRRTWRRAAVMLAGLALVLAACGGDGEGTAATTDDPEPTGSEESTSSASAEDSETSSEAAASESSTAAAGEITAEPSQELCPEDGSTWTIGYDTFSDTQEFAAARWEGLQMWQEELGCIEFIKAVDNADGATALANVQTFINREVDAVLLLQVVADAQAGIINELDDAGIPVLATDIVAPGAPFLSASDAEAGTQAGEALVEAYESSGSDQSPWVILGKVPAAGEVVGRRMENAEQVLGEQLGIPPDQILEVEVNQQTTEEAYNAARQVQGRIPDDVPVLITAVNDELALGIYQALDQADRGRDLITVGIGGLSAGLQATCQIDEWAGTVDYDPFSQTGYIVSELMLMLNDVEVPEEFFTPTEVIDAEGVQQKYPEQCGG